MVVNLVHERLPIEHSGPTPWRKAHNERGLRPSPPLEHPTDVAPLLRAVALSKVFKLPHGSIELFRGLNFEIHAGETVAIVGESGTGKSTLLHLLGALDAPTSGSIWFEGKNIADFTADEAADFRNRELGFVWQFHYLLPEFTALENIAMPLLARETPRAKALAEAAFWLDEVQLSHRAQNRAGELSGGEQQRCALARALVTNPSLLLADEPTGDLDNRTAEAVFSLIQDLHHAHGLTTLLVTHNEDFARRCDRMLRLEAGRLTPEPVTLN